MYRYALFNYKHSLFDLLIVFIKIDLLKDPTGECYRQRFNVTMHIYRPYQKICAELINTCSNFNNDLS